MDFIKDALVTIFYIVLFVVFWSWIASMIGWIATIFVIVICFGFGYNSY